MANLAYSLKTSATGPVTGHDAEEDAIILALEHAPTGAPMTRRDYGILGFLGVVVPVLLLTWGWQ